MKRTHSIEDITRMLEAGIITQAEAREMCGLLPVPHNPIKWYPPLDQSMHAELVDPEAKITIS